MKNRLISISILTLIALFPHSCVSEKIVDGPQSSEEVPVEFTVNIPYMAPETRSMIITEESKVSTVDVLAFYNDGNGQYRYGYTAPSVSRNINGSQLTETVKAKNYTLPQQFVVLVNASDELAAAGIILNELLPSAMNKIVCASGNGEWPAHNNGSPTFKEIPMYAKTDPQVVSEATPSIGTFPLIRMVARIDIRLKSNITNFELTQAMLFNYKTAGYVAYDFSAFDPDIPAATVATVPAAGDHSGDPIKAPTVTYLASTASDPLGEVIRSIYTFESPRFTEANRLKGTAVVVGGKYNGSLTTTYYRINLLTTDDDDPSYAYISSHILRNHSYDVEIQSVGGPGENTPIDAYLGSVKLVAKILEWNNALHNVEIPNPYTLMVDKDHLYFPGTGGSQTFVVITDYPDGWDIVDLPSWITVSPSSGSANHPSGAILTVDVDPLSSLPMRSDTFGVRAGNLTKTIRVSQE